jgi:uncharacterized protein (DUF1015 family)
MEVKPFKAFRYGADVVGDVGNCAAPPYDVITPEQQIIYQKNKYNIVWITKANTITSNNPNSDHYTMAANYLNDWIKQGALKQDTQESIYGYVHDFQLGGTFFQRLSFIALAKLEEFGKTIKPHEQVFDKPLIDRLKLERATAARFGLVFMLYQDKRKIADKIIQNSTTQTPLIDFIDDQDTRHRLFAITDKENIDAIVESMKDKICIIADGHHRYLTGLTYSKESTNPQAKYQMLAFANTYQKGLVVLATHRLVSKLENFSPTRFFTELKKNFNVTELTFKSQKAKIEAKQKMLAKMKAEYNNHKNAFGIYCGTDVFYVAVLKDKKAMDKAAPNMSKIWKELDVCILHKLIIEQILGIDEEKIAKDGFLEYVKDVPNALDESISRIDAKDKQVALFINPIKLEQLKLVTDAGERMPHKSTYFYPKMYSGITIQKL